MRKRTAQDWINLVALSLLALLALGGAALTYIWYSFGQPAALMLGWFVFPFVCSPVVTVLIAHAGITSLFKPRRIVANSWGWQVHYFYGRVDIQRKSRRGYLNRTAIRHRPGPKTCVALYAAISIAGLLYLAAQPWDSNLQCAPELTYFVTPSQPPPKNDKDIPTWYPIGTSVMADGRTWTSWPGMDGAVNGQIMDCNSYMVVDKKRHIVHDQQGNYHRLYVPEAWSTRDRIYAEAGF